MLIFSDDHKYASNTNTKRIKHACMLVIKVTVKIQGAENVYICRKMLENTRDFINNLHFVDLFGIHYEKLSFNNVKSLTRFKIYAVVSS